MRGCAAAGRFLRPDADETGNGALVILLAVGYVSLKRFFVTRKACCARDIGMESARQIRFTLTPGNCRGRRTSAPYYSSCLMNERRTTTPAPPGLPAPRTS